VRHLGHNFRLFCQRKASSLSVAIFKKATQKVDCMLIFSLKEV